jgi:hypothetical protein
MAEDKPKGRGLGLGSIAGHEKGQDAAIAENTDATVAIADYLQDLIDAGVLPAPEDVGVEEDVTEEPSA